MPDVDDVEGDKQKYFRRARGVLTQSRKSEKAGPNTPAEADFA